ncbi:MAG: orotidine-5'-phosphate decarboxylase [Chloroflexi bacterium]|nr:orotidine-5'-phosphate decarboxylase [Chloroflexota bacterium]
MTTFTERLWGVSRSKRSLVCVGLDPDPDLMAVPDVLEFNKAIIDATRDLVCAYKPNVAFYEALGRPGLDALAGTVAYAHSVAPDVIVLGDAKRGDIASTNKMYARALFEVWGFDATTVNGYCGGEALEPFFEYEDRGSFVLCRTSNPGATEIQDRELSEENPPVLYYQYIATRAREWNARDNVGLVAGATYPEDLGAVRARCPGMPMLVPGVGSQSGDLGASVRLGLDADAFNLLVSSSRGIIYASRDPKDFADAARKATGNLRDEINRILEQEGRHWSEN